MTTADRTPGFFQGLFLLLPITLAVVGISVFTATVAQMQDHFRYVPNGDYLVNLLQTMPGFWIIAFSPVAGWLADTFGRRTILLWAMLAYALAGVLPFWLENIYTILVTRCFVGMCESVIMTVTTTMLSDYFKGRARERWLASQSALASLSALVIIPLGGYLGAKFGWQGPFLVYLYSVPLALCVFIFCWEPRREAPALPSDAAVDADSRYQTMPWMRVLGIVGVTLIGGMMFYATITQNSNAFVILGVTNPAEIGNWATFASLGVPIGGVLFWRLGLLPIGQLLFVDFALIGAGFIWMSHASSPLQYVLGANIQQMGCGLIQPTLLVWATRGLAYHIRGRGTGLWQGALGLSLFISGATITFLSKQVGGLMSAFFVLGVVCLIAAIIALSAGYITGRKASLPSKA